MALAKGINSYVDVSEADAFFEDRLDAAAWTDANVTQKSQALITATAVLDSLSWVGVAVSETQPLSFPRVGEYFDPRVGAQVAMTSVTPLRVVRGTFELAYHLLNNDGLLDSTGDVGSISIGGISLGDVRAPDRVPYIVKRTIRPLLANAALSNTWWRAN